MLKRAIELAEVIYAAYPRDIEHTRDLDYALSDYGDLCLEGETVEAIAHYQRSVTLATQVK